ncbi:MAG: site-2 protease family protein [bacterium]|nr:site-2 protease family protein [bacterium]
MLFAIFGVDPLFIVPWIVTILLSIGVHEFAHALAGYWQGDDTAQRQGRLTLNPIAHVDWLGLMLLLVIGFGWGKPTPFNPYNLKYKKWGSALVSVAGPISNVIMVLVALIVFKVLGFIHIDWSLSTNLLEVFLLFMVQLNVVLFVFNLIPVPPLDGSKVLYTFLGYKRQALIQMLETQGPWLLLIVIIFGQGILSWIISFVMTLLYALFGII